MDEGEFMPMVRRALGSAIVTGASGASLALGLARPAANEALQLAFEAAVQARKGVVASGREGLRAAQAAGRPALEPALAAKDRLRERAMSALPPAVAGAAEAWRLQFIEGEKLAYFGTRRLSESLDPARELAWTRSRSVLAQAVDAFGEIAEAALATSVKFGEDLQAGELAPPKRKAAEHPRAKPRARRKGSKK